MKARMRKVVRVQSLLAALAALGVVACAPREPSTDAERLARGRELVQQMSGRLVAAKALTVTTSEVRDVVRASGTKQSVSQTGAYSLRRPDRFHIKVTGGQDLEAWYNGKVLTVASHQNKVFAQAPMPDTIDRTLDALAERYDMPLPLADLFYGSPEKALLSDTTTGGYAGTENVGGTECTHLAFQDVGVDWELWLPIEGELLPKRIKVVQKRRTGQPVADVTFTAWNAQPAISDATFVPKLPAAYEGIAILQRAAAIKHTAATPAGQK